MRYQHAIFVPVLLGCTVGAPCTTWSLMPSFGYGVLAADPKIRGKFVSFSQKSGVGWVPCGAGPARRIHVPPPGSSVIVTPGFADAARMTGRSAVPSHDHRLRNHRVGRTCSTASSVPALRIFNRMQTSSGVALA